MNDTPSTNPSNLGSMPGMMREVLNKFLQNIDDMLPAKVISYNRTSGRAQVQALVKVLKTDGTAISRAPVASVPVMHLGGGGFMLDFNLNPGDLGWIKANDRDISLFLQHFAEQPPNTLRKHDFSDALFIPDIMHGYTFNSEDATNAVLQSLDGTQRFAVWADRVKMTSGSCSITVTNAGITIDAPLTTFTGAVAGNSSRATSDAAFNGTIHATVDVTAQTVSLHGHVHSGVQSGSSDTGVPVP